MSTLQVRGLPPVPNATPITGKDIVTENWNRWFMNLRVKVNTIDAQLVSLSNINTAGTIVYNGTTFTSQALVTGTYGDTTHVPQITVGANGYITNITSVLLPVSGTVTSVGLAAPTQFTVTGSPVTTAGTLTFSWNTQSANFILAGPTTGVPAVPTFRTLVSADIPALNYVTSVALTMPGPFSVAGSPITSSGTFAVTLVTQTANTIWAGPTSGIPTTPSFRTLVVADLPPAFLDIAYLWTMI